MGKSKFLKNVQSNNYQASSIGSNKKRSNISRFNKLQKLAHNKNTVMLQYIRKNQWQLAQINDLYNRLRSSYDKRLELLEQAIQLLSNELDVNDLCREMLDKASKFKE